jgi:hypothetical protein
MRYAVFLPAGQIRDLPVNSRAFWLVFEPSGCPSKFEPIFNGPTLLHTHGHCPKHRVILFTVQLIALNQSGFTEYELDERPERNSQGMPATPSPLYRWILDQSRWRTSAHMKIN